MRVVGCEKCLQYHYDGVLVRIYVTYIAVNDAALAAYSIVVPFQTFTCCTAYILGCEKFV